MGVVFDVDRGIVVRDDGIAGHRDPVGHYDNGLLGLNGETWGTSV
jgi:hypothetical protein